MNDRKQHVITTAHQLFIENGFQATSIQDILDHSHISKGTFYNYFSSKNELLMAIFTYLNERLDEERDHLLAGHDPSDINIFVKQIELEFEYNGKNKLFNLLEEAFFTDDPTLKEFFKHSHMKQFHWTYNRFIDLLGKRKQPYLLDCTILFSGMLQQAIHFNIMTTGIGGNLNPVIRYIVNRLTKMAAEIEQSREQLFKPEKLYDLLPDHFHFEEADKEQLANKVDELKMIIEHHEDYRKYEELLTFVQEELTQSASSRPFLVKSALDTLAEFKGEKWEEELKKLVKLVEAF